MILALARVWASFGCDRPGSSRLMATGCCSALSVCSRLPRLCRPHLPGKAAVHRPARPAASRRRGRPLSRPTTASTLRGCYLQTTASRRGVILFGLEFGSNRWSCVPYCEHLRRAGYDVFAFEPRTRATATASRTTSRCSG